MFAKDEAESALLPELNQASKVDLLYALQTRIDSLGRFCGYLRARRLSTTPLNEERDADGTVWLEIYPQKAPAEIYRKDYGPVLPVHSADFVLRKTLLHSLSRRSCSS